MANRAGADLLLDGFSAALAAVDPLNCVPPWLPTPPASGRTVVAGAGKAAARMAQAVCAHYGGPVTGIVVTRYGHGLRPGETAPGIDVLEAGHPVPDAASVEAGERIYRLLKNCAPDDRVLFLLSGGASALMVRPAPGVSLADKQAVTRQLLAAGATIGEINAVRRKLSSIKGGGLARATPSRDILVLAISDVPGDEFGDIGSGPFSPDAPAPGDGAVFAAGRVRTQIVARSDDAVRAAARALEANGLVVRRLPEVTGSARDAAREHAALVRAFRSDGSAPFALVSGGEATVSLQGVPARGGRNGEYALALALALDGEAGVHVLAADTDGIDGSGDNAGVFAGPDVLERARGLGLDPVRMLDEHRTLEFFTALDGLLVTGPTRTNVNDLRIIAG